MTAAPVLLVDDDRDVAIIVKSFLTKADIQVDCVESGEEAIARAKSQTPALFLLDFMLPGVTGLEVCTLLRAEPKSAQSGIIMLTARDEEKDVVAGFEAGADDYIVKPFSGAVLVSRVRAVLARRGAGPQAVPEQPQNPNHLSLDPSSCQVAYRGTTMQLAPLDFALLEMLTKKPGMLFPKHELVSGLRMREYHVTNMSVEQDMSRLRKSLGVAGRHIETIVGIGYRFCQ